MSNSDGSGLLSGLLNAMADAVEKAAAGTALLNGRRRIPASGILYDADLILTASHVIEREDDVPVLLGDGTELTANLLGRDPGSDLAVLRLSSGVDYRHLFNRLISQTVDAVELTEEMYCQIGDIFASIIQRWHRKS